MLLSSFLIHYYEHYSCEIETGINNHIADLMFAVWDRISDVSNHRIDDNSGEISFHRTFKPSVKPGLEKNSCQL